MRGTEFDTAICAQTPGIELRETKLGQPLREEKCDQPRPFTHASASRARKFAVNPGPSAESNAGPRIPRRSARSRTNNTVGADMLP